ncbi:putative calcium-binding protein CML45 [Wolffia australiana]
MMMMIWGFFHLLVRLHRCTKPITASYDTVSPEEEIKDCPSCQKTSSGDFPTVEDAKTVIGKLGLEISSDEEEGDEEDGDCTKCRLIGGASRLLEEKVASVEELQRAFSVFDKNGDGFIVAEELSFVLLALGFSEGWKIDDCALMINAYDYDGDGRICFSEFMDMLQCAA